LQITTGSPTNSSAGTGVITLNGNAILDLSMTNTEINNVIQGGSTSVINIAMGNGNLWLSNAAAGQLSSFNGTFNITTTAANGGQLVVGTAALIQSISSSTIWQIYGGAVVDFNGSQYNPGTVYLYGSTVSGQNDGLLRLDASTQAGGVILMSNTVIGNGNAGLSTITGVISDVAPGYGYSKTGAGPIGLQAVNTYGGATTISQGTLLLQGLGSISNSSAINLATGTTLDVSELSSATFSLSTSNSLSATGAATNAATINGASGGTVAFGSQPVALTFKPQTFTGDATNQALNILQGSLTLGGNPITVTNSGASPLAAGNYALIQVTGGGTLSGTATLSGAVGGTGLAAGTAASLAISGTTLNLVVTNAFVPQPKINAFSRSGGNLIFSGTNGPANGTYTVLTTTNVALPTTSWTPVSTNTFSPTGTFSVTNAISGSTGFFIIEIP
jgi:autotransporter-associated beta strand protein